MSESGGRLALIRHGRSAHVHRGWIDHAGFCAWREAYEAAGLRSGERAPEELVRLVGGAGLVVSSDAPRAMESARMLAPGREITTSALLRELGLEAPRLWMLRMPLAGWAVSVGARGFVSRLRGGYPPRAEMARVGEAGDWLGRLAADRAFVVAVTHASLRGELATRLIQRGWRQEGRKRPFDHWSAWFFRRRGGGAE